QASGLTERQAQQWGTRLLAAIQSGLANPGIQRTRSVAPSAAYLKRLEGLREWRQKVALGLEVESDVVLPRALLLALAEGGVGQLHKIMSASPWRLRRFGDEIAAVLALPAPA
ncbi:MAG TPA: HRDC domain-containing protein, partial [Anaerolineales bacterium]|nr:HRDC domain-containing protein [Anaerolineales bacterium]